MQPRIRRTVSQPQNTTCYACTRRPAHCSMTPRDTREGHATHCPVKRTDQEQQVTFYVNGIRYLEDNRV